MSYRNTGGPVFPQQIHNDSNENIVSADGKVIPPGGTAYLHGMTLRDYFAAAALPAVIRNGHDAVINGGSVKNYTVEFFASEAYKVADGMLRERDK